MKRVITAVCMLLAVSTAFAFDTGKGPVRIGVLRLDEESRFRDQARVGDLVLERLQDELRKRGFDAFDAGVTFEEAGSDDATPADYYVELASNDLDGYPYGAASVGNSHFDVTTGFFAARVSGELRIFHGETLELISADNVSRRNRMFVPVSVGFGGRNFGAMLALPFINRAQYRSAAKAVARDAAEFVAQAIER